MVMVPSRAAELAEVFEETNPAELTRQITTIQSRLISLARDKTEAVTVAVSRAKIGEASEPISRAS